MTAEETAQPPTRNPGVRTPEEPFDRRLKGQRAGQGRAGGLLPCSPESRWGRSRAHGALTLASCLPSRPCRAQFPRCWPRLQHTSRQGTGTQPTVRHYGSWGQGGSNVQSRRCQWLGAAPTAQAPDEPRPRAGAGAAPTAQARGTGRPEFRPPALSGAVHAPSWRPRCCCSALCPGARGLGACRAGGGAGPWAARPGPRGSGCMQPTNLRLLLPGLEAEPFR